jgi:hypothetical protein
MLQRTDCRPLLILALAIAGGCKDKASSTDKGAGGTSPAAPSDSRGVPKDIDLLPVDSEVVVGVSWPELQASQVWQKLVWPELMKERELTQAVTEIKTRCGIDLLTEPTRVAAGLKGIDADLPDGAAVVHGLTKAKTLACVEKWRPEAEKERVDLKNADGIITARDSDGYGIGLVFISDTTALFMIGHQMTTERVKQAAAGASQLSTSQAFLGMYNKIDAKATVWGFARGATVTSEISDVLGIGPKAVFGSLQLDTGVTGKLYARLDSPERAVEAAQSMRPNIDAVAAMVDKAELSSDGPDLHLAVGASGTKLDALFTLIR